MKNHSYRISFPDLPGDSRHGDGQSPAYELRWRVWDLELVKSLPSEFMNAWWGAPKIDREIQPWPPLGVFIPRGYVEEPGLMMPLRDYDPVPQADELLTHVTRLETDDTEAILKFVNRWGPLGLSGDLNVYARLGIWPGAGTALQVMASQAAMFFHVMPAEPVFWVQRALERIKFMAQALYKFQRRQYPRRADAVVYSWTDFSDELNGMIRGIRRVTRQKKGGGLQVLECPSSLLDVLGLALLDRATGITRQRRCPECGSYFVPTRNNQKFCKRGGEQYCARKHTLRAWRHQTRRKVRRR
jgi:hypothetical protein